MNEAKRIGPGKAVRDYGPAESRSAESPAYSARINVFFKNHYIGARPGGDFEKIDAAIRSR